jgi:glycosyl transferase family 9 (putative heptosyltransferase)
VITTIRYSQRPAIFFSSGIGDGVLALPALRALCFGFDGRATLILKKGPDKFLFDGLRAHRLLFLDMWGSEAGPGMEFATEAASGLFHGCDLFLSFVDWHSPSLYRLKSECMAKPSVEFLREHNLCEPSDLEKHQFDSMFAISARIFPELTIDKFSHPLEFSANVRGAGEEILQAFGGRVWIGFHPESSFPAKSCPGPFVEDVIKHLLGLSTNLVVCVFGQKAEYSDFEAISKRVLVFNCLPLKLAAYLVSRMSLFIGVDSCFLHVADICRVPGVGLFGPTDCRLFGFRFSPHVHIQSDLHKITGVEIATAARSLSGF